MKGEGGCCIAKYGGVGGGGEGMYGMSKVDRIMLKFRPIAPKPMAVGSGGSTMDSGDGYVKCGRSKRKYVRVKKSERDNCKRRRKVKASSTTTLSLLPETPDRKENDVVPGFCSDLVSPVQTTNKQQSPPNSVVCMLSGPGLQKHLVQTTKCNNNSNNNIINSINTINNNKPALVSPAPVWLRFDSPEQVRVQTNVIKPSPSPSPSSRLPRLVSYVTVECVTDTWEDWKALGCTDEEIVINMEKDTCPGFISDAQGTVVWTNTAYKHMSGSDNIMVVLVRKDKCSVTNNNNNIVPAFTCKVKVTFAGHSHRQTTALTVPCDVWRMKHGGFAWRLDVNAALSLGR